jgi:hypothetical protein
MMNGVKTSVGGLPTITKVENGRPGPGREPIRHQGGNGNIWRLLGEVLLYAVAWMWYIQPHELLKPDGSCAMEIHMNILGEVTYRDCGTTKVNKLGLPEVMEVDPD